MRLDKLISECGLASRTETARACRSGSVTVNGVPVRKPDTHIDPDADRVVFCGKPVVRQQFVYLLLNKPQGYVSATDDRSAPCVTELVPSEYRRKGIFPCGRLDKYTTGLMLLTNDGPLAHRLLAPKSHVTKSYGFTTERPLSRRGSFGTGSGYRHRRVCNRPLPRDPFNARRGGYFHHGGEISSDQTHDGSGEQPHSHAGAADLRTADA